MRPRSILLLLLPLLAGSASARTKVLFEFTADRPATRRFRISCEAFTGPEIRPSILQKRLFGREKPLFERRMALGFQDGRRVLLWTSVYKPPRPHDFPDPYVDVPPGGGLVIGDASDLASVTLDPGIVIRGEFIKNGVNSPTGNYRSVHVDFRDGAQPVPFQGRRWTAQDTTAALIQELLESGDSSTSQASNYLKALSLGWHHFLDSEMLKKDVDPAGGSYRYGGWKITPRFEALEEELLGPFREAHAGASPTVQHRLRYALADLLDSLQDEADRHRADGKRSRAKDNLVEAERSEASARACRQLIYQGGWKGAVNAD